MIRALMVLVLVFAPVVTFAAPGDFFGPIIPACARAAADQYPCQACDLVSAGENILRVFVSLAVGAAALMFAYAGILYVTAAANQGNIDSAKSIFFSTLLGLIFILCAYLIIDLALRVFTGQSFNVLSNISCVKVEYTDTGFSYSRTTRENPVTAEPGGGGAPASYSQCAAGTGLTHQAALARLNATGRVTVTSTSGPGGVRDGCSGVGCTTLTNICDGTVTGMEGIARDNPCGAVTIWGASEGGDAHGGSTHRSGCAFDISPSNTSPSQWACLGSWLQQNRSKYGITQMCTPAKYDSYTFGCGSFREGNDHYHVTFCSQ